MAARSPEIWRPGDRERKPSAPSPTPSSVHAGDPEGEPADEDEQHRQQDKTESRLQLIHGLILPRSGRANRPRLPPEEV
jgi:hypothetical protein